MHWYQYLLILVLFFLFFLIVSHVKVKLIFKKDDKNDLFEAHIWLLYNLIHLKKTIPLIVFESFSEGIKYKTKTSVNNDQKNNEIKDQENEEKERITPQEAKKYHMDYKKLLVKINDLKGTLEDFLQHIHLEKIWWKTVVGTDDALITGLLAGTLWGIKGTVIGIASKYMKLKKKPEIIVEPVFQQLVLQTYFECILRFRVGYVFLTGIKLAIKLIKGGRKKWQENNIPFKV